MTETTPEVTTEEPKAPPRLVQAGLFGVDRVLNETRRAPKWSPRVRPDSLLSEVPLLEPLTERRGRGRPSERPIGMSHSTWVYWGRWAKNHTDASQPVPEALAAFLTRNREATLGARRHRLAEATKDPVRTHWRTIKAWKDLTAAEERDWKRRIANGTTDGVYRVGLRGLQKLEAVR